jgi:glycosyltransferase involved in cell wall biosynthesis
MDSTKRLKTIFLTPRFPYPLIGGDRIKSYKILSHLSRKHDVTLVTFFQGEYLEPQYLKAIEDLGVRVIVAPLSPLKAVCSALIHNRLLDPLEINYYTQQNFKKIVNKLLKEETFDLGFSFFMRTAEYLKQHNNLKKVLIAEDCRTLYQYRSYKESDNLIQKAVRLFDYKALQKYEPRISNHFDFTTLVTTNDISAMRQANPKAEFRLLTNGADMFEFTPPIDNSQRKGLFFCGKMDTWANVMMAKKIAEEILPLVRKEIPDCTLTIAGANPVASVLRLKSEHVKVLSKVPSLTPYYQSAAVFPHPHAGGSGIQNKLLEAMACGCPVVTTKVGNQGIDGAHGKDLMIAENVEEIATHTIRIIKDRKLMDTISHNARDLMIRTHSWDSIFSALDRIIEEL